MVKILEAEMPNGRIVAMEVGPLIFRGADLSMKPGPGPTLAFFWIRETQFSNIVYTRILSFTISWPWVRCRAAFVDRDEPAPEEEE